LISFGNQPTKVSDELVDLIRARESSGEITEKRLFDPGESIRVVDGPFTGIEGMFQSIDGTQRVMTLIELLSKTVRMAVSPIAFAKPADRPIKAKSANLLGQAELASCST
jgi:transcriptional antiterminator RfaH